MKPEPTYIGIDVAKDRVDIAVRPSGQIWSAPYEEEEMEKLVARLQALEPATVILEATGGLELTLVAAMAAASLPVAVVNPRQVRDFAKSTGQLAKNDRLDAQVLAHFGEAIHPPMRALRDSGTQIFGAMLARRRQLVAILVAEKNRLSRALREVRPRIEAHIAWLEQELSDLDGKLRQTILSRPVARKRPTPSQRPGCGEPGVHDNAGRPA